MEDSLASLLVVSLVAVIAPVIATNIPKRILPEVVLLLGAGMLLGPHALGFIGDSHDIDLFRELGMGFLFLMAGYDIDPQEVKGNVGRGALVAWLGSLTCGFTVVYFLPGMAVDSTEGISLGILLSATALGTILPILKDRGLSEKPVGITVMAHGAIGEIGPILMMALFLSLYNTWESVAIVTIFAAVSLLLAWVPQKAQQLGMKVVRLIHFESRTTAQLTVRLTVCLLIGLVFFAELLGLDLALGAFAAGFIMRQALPTGRRELDEKLDGLAFGLFIPFFFVLSGAQVDISALTLQPWVLVIFLLAILVVRGLPVFFTLFFKFASPAGSVLHIRQRAIVALYVTTNLPIIVAVTQVAVAAKAMTVSTASLLIISGTASVLLMPLLATIIEHLPQRKSIHQSSMQKS